MPGAIGYWDADLRCRFANQAYFDWFGKAPHEVLGTHYRDLVDEHFFRANEPHVRGVLAGEKQCFERAVAMRDGSIRHALVNFTPDVAEAGSAAGFFVNVSDVSPLKNVEAQLEVAAAVFNHAADGIIVTDASGTILSVNPAFTEITAYRADEAIGRNPRFLKSGRHSREFYDELWCDLTTTGRWRGQVWNRRKDGDVFLEQQTITAIRDGAGQALRYVSVFSDMTESWNKNERIRQLALHDELTGLPNRSVFIERLSAEIRIAERDSALLAVMFIDLDGFKAVNDRLGHATGDAMLVTVARKLQAVVRRTDIVARVGGDEFVALIPDLPSEDPVARIATNMIATIGEPQHFDGQIAHVGASIGIAIYPAQGRTAADLMGNADAAMYAVKAAGKNAFGFARPLTRACA